MISREAVMTKAALAEKTRRIIDKYDVNEFLEGYDKQHFLNLIEQHPDAAQKIGCGIKAIQKQWLIHTAMMVLHRTDNSSTDFSWRQCIYGKPTKRTRVANAFRQEIADQIIKFKETPDPNFHVDHIVSFQSLLNDFLTDCNFLQENIKLEEHNDNTWQERILDRELAAQWSEYHQMNAQLQVITAQENLRK